MELRKSRPLKDIAAALNGGEKLSVTHSSETPILCRCYNCHHELFAYQRHKKSQAPFVYYLDEGYYHRSDQVQLPEEIVDGSRMGTSFFGMNAGINDGICPQCGADSSQIWLYRFASFPIPNVAYGHMPGSEKLYQYDPVHIVDDFRRCDLRILSLCGEPIGCMLHYQGATVKKDAFHGWPTKNFQCDFAAFFIDGLLTNAATVRRSTNSNADTEVAMSQLLRSEQEDAETVVRALNQLATEFLYASATRKQKR